jgi:hypothetical protein
MGSVALDLGRSVHRSIQKALLLSLPFEVALALGPSIDAESVGRHRSRASRTVHCRSTVLIFASSGGRCCCSFGSFTQPRGVIDTARSCRCRKRDCCRSLTDACALGPSIDAESVVAVALALLLSPLFVRMINAVPETNSISYVTCRHRSRASRTVHCRSTVLILASSGGRCCCSFGSFTQPRGVIDTAQSCCSCLASCLVEMHR